MKLGRLGIGSISALYIEIMYLFLFFTLAIYWRGAYFPVPLECPRVGKSLAAPKCGVGERVQWQALDFPQVEKVTCCAGPRRWSEGTVAGSDTSRQPPVASPDFWALGDQIVTLGATTSALVARVSVGSSVCHMAKWAPGLWMFIGGLINWTLGLLGLGYLYPVVIEAIINLSFKKIVTNQC